MSSKKQEILDSACQALQERGIGGFSFRDLATSAGIKSSSVHYHFPSKNDLFKELIIHFRGKVAAYLNEIENKGESLKEILSLLVDMFEGELDQGRFCVCGMLAAEQAHLEDEVLEELRTTFQGLEAWLTQIIDKYSQSSLMSPHALAMILISSLEGAMLIDRVNDDKEYFSAIREMINTLT